MQKKIGVFGSTGSIGVQAMELLEKYPDKFKVSILTCGRNIEIFRVQLGRHRPALAVTAAEEDAVRLGREFPGTEFMFGGEGLGAAAAKGDYDIILNALSGVSGMLPTYRAVQRDNKEIALANKEALVAGGEVIMAAASEHGARIFPVDSEHSAVFQCMRGNEKNEVRRIILTASGGPFRGYTKERLKTVTRDEALGHPNWKMGKKVTVDSATLMNKGLEVIEARWLFGVEAEKIQVLIHPQSIVHSMVEFKDNALLAQLGPPDMRIPISYALFCPARAETGAEQIDFLQLGRLEFEPVDTETFTALKLAYQALKQGGSYPAAMNAANEVLVQLFLEEKIGFTDIQETIERVLNAHKPVYGAAVEQLLEIDALARAETTAFLDGICF
ncbi:MAG: 1-deoxy-D-xylulose-5-phosphate reductoisomerase [Clostridiales Family XIII bacterium]|jgi:1-deoxy-D-xylulose-5-phosphate reductoisomerase|nr:1-deoxy-D-xylulose-5-phosphate reductoisomerase [Clostridiales Family XIII bacterium]